MENNAQPNYKIHSLTFLRNNSYAQKINFDEERNCFFMMDYYNLLRERELKDDTDGYMVLTGERKGEVNAVAKRVMGIYAEKDLQDRQIFQAASTQESTTTKNPFLGMIQVYITDYLWIGHNQADLQNIDYYLDAYKEKIEECLTDVLDEDDIYRIYRTITSEDFCVIIRTSKFRKIYDAALKMMRLKNASNRRVFFTYTNVGIELKEKGKNENGDITGFLNLHESVREKNRDLNFVLRFRIENEALEEIQAIEFQQKNKDESAQQFVIEAVNGMIGRYDLVVQFDMDEFMEIYPFLCLNITGYEISAKMSDFSTQLVGILVEKMKQRIIQTINTRVIMDIYAKENSGSTQAVSIFDKDDIYKIELRRKQVQDKYDEFIKKHEAKFLAEKYRYDELRRMLDSLISSYENLAYEIDTHINWFICSQYLEELFQSMISYMDHVGKEPKYRAIQKFLNEFQEFVSAFDVYLRLLQGINQNTIQAPRYDISAPVDGQKFLMAYSEFIDTMHEAYRNDEWQNKGNRVSNEKRKKEKTIIYPNLTIKNVELMEVFDYDKKDQPETGSEQTTLLICKIPMFEYFQRPYDLIPLVSHEICHHMLILDREIRNEFLIRRVFKAIAAEAVQEIVRSKYKNRVDALTEVMTETLATVLVTDFKKENREWKQYVFRHLSQKIYGYVASYFADRERLNSWFSLSELKKTEFQMLISELYEDGEEEQNNFRKNVLITHDKAETFFVELTKFTQKYLDRINDLTIQYNRPITFENLFFNDQIELDNYLLQWVKENEKNILKAEVGREENGKREIIQEKAEKKQYIKNYLELIKRTISLYTDIISDSTSRAEEKRKNLAEEFAKKAKRQFDKFLDEDECYYIYDQDKLKKAAFWEFKDVKSAAKHYMEAMEYIDPKKMYNVIEFRTIIYREACADAAMCRWLGLSSFGYFRMSITQTLRMQGHAEQMQYRGAQWDRLVIVLAVLEKMRNPDCENKEKWTEIDLSDMQNTIWQYVEKAMQDTKKRIKATMYNDKLDETQSEKVLDSFFEMLEATMHFLEKRILENRTIVWKNSMLDRLFKGRLPFFDEIPEYCKYFQKEANIFKRLYEILDAYGRVQKNNKIHIETEVLEHIVDVYKNMTEEKEPHRVIKEVVAFYNDPGSEEKSNSQKMVDMLQFVQDYYYCNRIKKAEEKANGNLVCKKPE